MATSAHKLARKKLKAARKLAKASKKAVCDTRERSKVSARLALKLERVLEKLVKKAPKLKLPKSAKPAGKPLARRSVSPRIVASPRSSS